MKLNLASLLVLGLFGLALLAVAFRSSSGGTGGLPPRSSSGISSTAAAQLQLGPGDVVVAQQQQQAQQQALHDELASLRQLILQLQHTQAQALAADSSSKQSGGDDNDSNDIDTNSALDRLEAQLAELKALYGEQAAELTTLRQHLQSQKSQQQSQQSSSVPDSRNTGDTSSSLACQDTATALSRISGLTNTTFSSWTRPSAYPVHGQPELDLPPLPRCWLEAFARGPSVAPGIPNTTLLVHSQRLEIPQSLVPRPHPVLHEPPSKVPGWQEWPRHRWLFAGPGYTGTGLASHLLKELGWDVGHEKRGVHGESSWLLSFPRLPARDYRGAHPEMFETVIMMIRNPLGVVRSGRATRWVAEGHGHHSLFTYYKRHLRPRIEVLWPELGFPDTLGDDMLNVLMWLSHGRAAMYFTGCTDPTAGNTERRYASHLVWRTDMDRAEDLLARLGIPVTPEIVEKALAATQIRKNAHAKAHTETPSWKELRTAAVNVPGDATRQQRMLALIEEAYDLSRALGYTEEIEARLYSATEAA